MKPTGHRTLDSLLVAGAAASTLLGLLVIFGWFVGSSAIVQLHPALVPMQFNAALCFAAAGVVWLCVGRAPRIGYAAALLVTFVGGATLVQYVVEVDFGIDELLWSHDVVVHTSQPGRMAPNTALCFLLTGMTGLVELGGRRFGRFSWIDGRGVVEVLACIVLLLGVLALIGYIVDIPANYAWGRATRMALHTSAGFVCLGTVALVHAIGGDRDGREGSSWLQWSFALGTFGVVVAVWQGYIARDARRTDTTELATARSVAEAANESLASDLRALARMAKRWSIRRPSHREWSSDAAEYVRDMATLHSLRWLDVAGSVRWEVPEDPDSTALSTEQRAAAAEAVASSAPVYSGLIAEGGATRTFMVAVPLQSEGASDGCLLAFTSVDRLLAQLSRMVGTAYQLRFDEPVAISAAAAAVPSAEGKRNDGGEPWPHVRFGRTALGLRATDVSPPSPLRGGFLIIGLGLAALVAMVTTQLRTARRNRMFLEDPLEASPVPQLSVGGDGTIRVANRAALELFRATGQGLVGRSFDELVPGRLRSGHEIDFDPPDGQADDAEQLMARCLDGSEVPVEIGVGSRIGTQPGALMVTVIDVTNLRRAEAARARSEDRLTRANEELEQFAYVASHDLRSPMRAITNIVSWLAEDLDEHLTEGTRANMDMLHSRVHRMDRLLDSLLEYSRAGRSSPPEDVAVAQLIHDIQAMVDLPDGFRIEVGDWLPEVRTDRLALFQVLLNLVSNSIKHHDKAEGRIRIESRSLGDMLEFTVSDDGPGIPEDARQRVFEMFTTLKPRDEVEGSGMGLALARRRVAQHGGRIEVGTSDLGGARVRFTWSAERPAAGA